MAANPQGAAGHEMGSFSAAVAGTGSRESGGGVGAAIGGMRLLEEVCRKVERLENLCLRLEAAEIRNSTKLADIDDKLDRLIRNVRPDNRPSASERLRDGRGQAEQRVAVRDAEHGSSEADAGDVTSSDGAPEAEENYRVDATEAAPEPGQDHGAGGSQSRTVGGDGASSPAQQGARAGEKWDEFKWDGDDKSHIVPHDYVFPVKLSVGEMYKRWHVGEKVTVGGEVKTIRPLKMLHRPLFRGDITSENTRKNLGKAVLVMGELDRICRQYGIIGPNEEIGAENHERCYTEGFKLLVTRMYGEGAWDKRRKRRRTENDNGKGEETRDERSKYCLNSYISFYNELWRKKKADEAAGARTRNPGTSNPGDVTYADMILCSGQEEGAAIGEMSEGGKADGEGTKRTSSSNEVRDKT